MTGKETAALNSALLVGLRIRRANLGKLIARMMARDVEDSTAKQALFSHYKDAEWVNAQIEEIAKSGFVVRPKTEEEIESDRVQAFADAMFRSRSK